MLLIADRRCRSARGSTSHCLVWLVLAQKTESIAKLVLPGARRCFAIRPRQESAVKAAAVDKSVLHFATHAIRPRRRPVRIVSGAGRDVGRARLGRAPDRAGDLRVESPRRSVVLSACRSGAGHITGDGVATFARAFMYAGTPSLIVSLWDVADEASNRLLPGFYRAMVQWPVKSPRPRAAQLQLLRDLRAGKVQVKTAAGLVALPEHPVFWAGVALIGEPE
jgi:CHAT domain-containing protein